MRDIELTPIEVAAFNAAIAAGHKFSKTVDGVRCDFPLAKGCTVISATIRNLP